MAKGGGPVVDADCSPHGNENVSQCLRLLMLDAVPFSESANLSLDLCGLYHVSITGKPVWTSLDVCTSRGVGAGTDHGPSLLPRTLVASRSEASAL